ncbi:LppX_LprAFG lipoprotein [Actinomadura viridis]|uniref:LppX_LprAFG lipoprotein n=1 Tax=Actinomadura viridis TaxID=58110 RepID=UPI0036C7DCFE
MPRLLARRVPLTGVPRALLAGTMAATVMTACSGGDGGGAAPAFDAADTLRRSSAAMAGLKSIGFTMTTEGKPPIMVRGGEMKLLRGGDADGTVTVEQSGQKVEMEIVASGDSVYIKAVTGGWRKVPRAMAATLYDPSAVLDPERGISKLLTTVTGPRAEATEKVGGKEARRVGVTLPKAAVGGLIPGVDADVKGQVWVSTADHRLLKVKGDVPPAAEGGDRGSVIINFTEFDAPYTIKAPA